MPKPIVAVIGASGYAGAELVSILRAHPEVSFLTNADRRGLVSTLHTADFLGDPPRYEIDRLTGFDAVFFATPAEVSLALITALEAAGGGKTKWIDLSGAFRLKRSENYAQYYGFMHEAPGLAAAAVYGLSEWAAGKLATAGRVANPGCYATAAALAAAPLIARGLIEPEIIVDAASGTTGAGRQAKVDLSFSEVFGDFRAYKIFKHQHTPEISQTLSALGGRPVRVTLTTHLLLVARGILATVYAQLAPGARAADVTGAFADVYAGAPFVELVPAEDVSLRRVAHTNRCAIGHAVCEHGDDAGRVIVTAAIDNLQKGAAGQAVQNLNLMMGWPEATGLAGAVFGLSGGAR